jgi:hypothetical protein
MKLRNPIYLAFALSVTVLVALANHNGWSAMSALSAGTWRHFNPSTQHK